jgi:hypothetical protein
MDDGRIRATFRNQYHSLTTVPSKQSTSTTMVIQKPEYKSPRPLSPTAPSSHPTALRPHKIDIQSLIDMPKETYNYGKSKPPREGQKYCHICRGAGTLTHTCYSCDGNGRVTTYCRECRGTGKVGEYVARAGKEPKWEPMVSCPSCGGRGKTSATCPYRCGGKKVTQICGGCHGGNALYR